MKKILFAACSLNVGGVETALVTLIDYLLKRGYDITLVLEEKQGIFLDEINEKVKIVEYVPNRSRNKLLAKFSNAINRLKFIMKYKNKFDCSISFATYSLPASFVARASSNNSVLWVHNNYLSLLNNDENEYLKFFQKLNAKRFRRIVFVSEESKNDFEKRFDGIKDKLIVCNNLIDYKKIISKSKEKINFDAPNGTIFLNIGRHDEKQKMLSRLLDASKRLSDDGYNFKVILVGDGKDNARYREQVKILNIQDKIIFEGQAKNPYPYYNYADSVIMTSDYEGYPVVYVESLVFNKPIITTNVSDSKKDIQGKYGLVCDKTVDDIYVKMKYFMDNGYEIKEKFKPEEFNEKIARVVEDIIEEKK